MKAKFKVGQVVWCNGCLRLAKIISKGKNHDIRTDCPNGSGPATDIRPLTKRERGA